MRCATGPGRFAPPEPSGRNNIRFLKAPWPCGPKAAPPQEAGGDRRAQSEPLEPGLGLVVHLVHLRELAQGLLLILSDRLRQHDATD
jgi:hypothetical protein